MNPTFDEYAETIDRRRDPGGKKKTCWALAQSVAFEAPLERNAGGRGGGDGEGNRGEGEARCGDGGGAGSGEKGVEGDRGRGGRGCEGEKGEEGPIRWKER